MAWIEDHGRFIVYEKFELRAGEVERPHPIMDFGHSEENARTFAEGCSALRVETLRKMANQYSQFVKR